MFKSSKNEYAVKTCPTDEPEFLEELLNSMSEKGWELYTLHEADGRNGDVVYNCIFYRDKEEDSDSDEKDDEIVDVDDFRSKMEKIFEKNPYIECKEVQEKIKERRLRIKEIKACLDSTAIDEDDRIALNSEMSAAMKDLEVLRNKLAETISPQKFYEEIGVNKITIKLSDELLDMVNPDNGAELVSLSVKLRQDLTQKLGYVIPGVYFKPDDTLESCEYKILIRDIEVLKSNVYPDYLMFYKDEISLSRKPASTIEGFDFVSGREILWIDNSKTKKFWEKGLSAAEVIAKNLEYIVCRYVDEIFDYSDVNRFVEIAGSENLYLIENIMPDFLSVGELRYILASLIREKVPVRDVVYIFEKINDFSVDAIKDDLLEKLRIALSRQICQSVSDENHIIYGVTLCEKITDKLTKYLCTQKKTLTISGNFIQKVAKNLNKVIENSDINSEFIVLVVPLELRHFIFQIFEQIRPNLSVIAKEEITSEFVLENVGEVDI